MLRLHISVILDVMEYSRGFRNYDQCAGYLREYLKSVGILIHGHEAKAIIQGMLDYPLESRDQIEDFYYFDTVAPSNYTIK